MRKERKDKGKSRGVYTHKMKELGLPEEIPGSLFSESLGTLLKSARMYRGYTAKDLAQNFETTIVTIQNLENDLTANFRTIQAILEYLQVDLKVYHNRTYKIYFK